MLCTRHVLRITFTKYAQNRKVGGRVIASWTNSKPHQVSTIKIFIYISISVDMYISLNNEDSINI